MTQHRVEIKAEDREGWKQWMECLAQMHDELRALDDEQVSAILDRYEFKRCDYGFGINLDWPEK